MIHYLFWTILRFFMRFIHLTKVAVCSLMSKMPISTSTTTMAEMKAVNFVKDDKILIVGLGNYDMPRTRHSVGMRVVDYLARVRECKWERNRAVNGFVAQFSHEPEIWLLKSKHFMNLSGKSVKKAVTNLDVPVGNIYLICDELDKTVGKFSIKEGGSTKGHNGVRSVTNALQTLDIPRLLVGIDRPASKSDVAFYVLRPFTAEEDAVIEKTLPNAAKLILSHLQKRMGEDCEHNLIDLLPKLQSS